MSLTMLVVAALLAISELLAQIDAVESNSVFQLIVNLLKMLKGAA